MYFMGKLALMAVLKIENQSRRFLFEKIGYGGCVKVTLF